jgi:hypothetical protein
VAPKVAAVTRFADIDGVASRLAERRLVGGQRKFAPPERPAATAAQQAMLGMHRARRSAVPASGNEARRQPAPLLYAVGPPALTHCRTTSLNTSSGTEPVFSTTS